MQRGSRRRPLLCATCENDGAGMVRLRDEVASGSVETLCFTETVTRPAPTHALRGPTGLDIGARKAMLRTIHAAGVSAAQLVFSLIHHGAYGDVEEFIETVEQKHGALAVAEIEAARVAALRIDESRLDWETAKREAEQAAAPVGLLRGMPEGDFLDAIEIGVRIAKDPYDRAGRLAASINRTCERRGIHYRLTSTLPSTFEWVGDSVMEAEAIVPALSALDDPRLSGGPKDEFEAAREELRKATPGSRKQAVAEACNAVESTMKVLCDEHGVPRPMPAVAGKLFDALLAAGIVAENMKSIVMGPAHFGNPHGRHGAGPMPHNVSVVEAEQVVGAAAVAVVYLAKLLP
jgi:hypothetical protein